MPGLVENYSATLGWTVCKCNVVVEGTSDVAVAWLAADLYFERHQSHILGDQLAILHAGRGTDGGVDGLNRRLTAVRQNADADRGPDGSLQYRFIGLYDHDYAGRRAVTNACAFDPRLRQYGDLFLLHPIMPLASGANYLTLKRRFEDANAKYNGLDWEIEDLLSERILSAFEVAHPRAVQKVVARGGLKHRDFTRDGKAQLLKFAQETAALEDMIEVIKLIRALRDYHRLKIDHIIC